MSFLETVKANFFREPRGRRIDWMPVVFGTIMVVLSTAGMLVGAEQGEPFRSEPEFGILGLAFVSMGGAELLSGAHRRSLATLRAVAIMAFVSFLVTFLLTF